MEYGKYMPITDRQNLILEKIVKDYIDLAQPISSELLEKKHHFGLSPATLRIEMQKLTDAGFLSQPHTSAGRVPTDKGYRFFVDNLFEKESFEWPEEKLSKEIQQIEKGISNSLRFSQEITKILASFSSNLALSYLFDEKIFWKEGWPEILDEPEFRDADYIKNFMEMVEKLEENIKNFAFGSSEVKVYIGRENPVSKAKDFSLIISQSQFPKRKKGTLAILGPKRMNYNKNIGLINSLTKLLE